MAVMAAMAVPPVVVVVPDLVARMATGAMVVLLGPQGMAAMGRLVALASWGVMGAMAAIRVHLELAGQLAQVWARPALLGLPVRRPVVGTAATAAQVGRFLAQGLPRQAAMVVTAVRSVTAGMVAQVVLQLQLVRD